MAAPLAEAMTDTPVVCLRGAETRQMLIDFGFTCNTPSAYAVSSMLHPPVASTSLIGRCSFDAAVVGAFNLTVRLRICATVDSGYSW
jgi:hypothetical protein